MFVWLCGRSRGIRGGPARRRTIAPEFPPLKELDEVVLSVTRDGTTVTDAFSMAVYIDHRRCMVVEKKEHETRISLLPLSKSYGSNGKTPHTDSPRQAQTLCFTYPLSQLHSPVWKGIASLASCSARR